MANTATGAGAATSEATGTGTATTSDKSKADAGGSKTTEQTGESKSGAPGEGAKADEKTGEQKTGSTTDAGSGKEGSKAGEQQAQPKAPDKYELTAPEALKAYADPATIAEVEAFARANNLPNEDAQQILEDTLSVVKQRSANYEAATKADKTYGGDNFGETQRLARKVIDRVRPEGHARRDSFLSFLGREGAGNHIEVVSFLADLGRLMAEDSPSHGRSSGAGGDGAGKLYDHADSKRADQQG